MKPARGPIPFVARQMFETASKPTGILISLNRISIRATGFSETFPLARPNNLTGRADTPQAVRPAVDSCRLCSPNCCTAARLTLTEARVLFGKRSGLL